jgi:hypothetical protein
MKPVYSLPAVVLLHLGETLQTLIHSRLLQSFIGGLASSYCDELAF